MDFALGSMLVGLGSRLLKMRIPSDVPLRPRFCRGPDHPGEEVTFLLGVSKKGRTRTPSESNKKAVERLRQIEDGQAQQTLLREDETT
jgi:hypothetical protein